MPTHEIIDSINRLAGDIALAIATGTDAEAIDAYKGRTAILDAYRALARVAEDALIERIAERGDIVHGTDRYYVGIDRKYTCRDMSRTVRALLSVGERVLLDCLSASALKPGAVKALIGDSFAEHFDTEEVQDIKTGKPRRVVQNMPANMRRPQNEH